MIIRALGTILITATLAGHIEAQSTAARQYQYRVTGTVIDVHKKPAVGTEVCWWSKDRAMVDPIPCVKTDEQGRFELTVKDVPGRYYVSASTDAKALSLGRGRYRLGLWYFTSSHPFEFGSRDESRSVDLRLAKYKWSKKDGKYQPKH